MRPASARSPLSSLTTTTQRTAGGAASKQRFRRFALLSIACAHLRFSGDTDAGGVDATVPEVEARCSEHDACALQREKRINETAHSLVMLHHFRSADPYLAGW